MKRLSTILSSGLIVILAISGCRKTVRTSHDIIYLINGEEMTGHLKQISADSVWFQAEQGSQSLARSEVRSLDLPQPRPGEEWEHVSDIDDPFLKDLFANLSPPQTDSRYINLYVEHHYKFNQDGTFEKKMRVIRLITAESGKGVAANNTWSYLADRSYAKVDFARSYGPEGIVTHITGSAINRVSLHPAPSEYSNLTQLQIAVPESRVGSILDFQFSTIQNKVDSIHPISEELVLGDNQPTMIEVIKVEQPENGPLAVNVSLPTVPPSEKQMEKGNEVMTWTIENQPPLRQEFYTPPQEDFLPHFFIANKETWHSIASHLKGHFKQACIPGDRIPILVDSLTNHLSYPRLKAEALYEYVITTIRPAGPGYPDFSYLPTPAETVIVRGFANNLDRAVLLTSLMKQADLEADLILLRNRNYGRLEPTFAALGQLTDAFVLLDSETYLNPSPNIPFGTLTEQDAMGLSITSGKLKKTPALSPDKEALFTESSATLSPDGTLNLSVQVKITGENSIAWKRYLKNLSPTEVRQEAEEISTQIHPNAILQDFEIEGVKELNQNVTYSLRLRIPNYATRAGNYLILYLPGIDHSAYHVGAINRLYPIDRQIRSLQTTSLNMKFPAGSKLVYYPEDVSASNKYDSYSASFIIPKTGTLQFNETTQVLDPWIPATEYPNYKEIELTKARLTKKPIVIKL